MRRSRFSTNTWSSRACVSALRGFAISQEKNLRPRHFNYAKGRRIDAHNKLNSSLVKRLAPAYLIEFAALVIGYLAGEWILDNTKPPGGLWVDVVIIAPLVGSAIVVVNKYQKGSYGRKVYKYWMGQLGAWLMGLLIGGFLPLLKSWVYSPDFWTRAFLVPWVLGWLYVFLVGQEWFKTPKPIKPS